MGYKEKYEQSLEKASKLRWQNPFDTVGQMVEYIFPELTESDERIRKGIIALIEFGLDDKSAIAPGYNITKEEAIAWLEKQREKPQGKSALESIKEEKVNNQNCVKSADKIEPKFKVGDWITDSDINTFQITKIDNWWYYADDDDKACFDVVHDYYHLWTLQDAKEGDILAFDDNTIVIFKDLYNATSFHSYCYIKDGLFGVSEDGVPDWWEGEGFYPTTKEQRDLLFQKMKDAGYEYDAETQELSKIADKSSLNEDD